MTHCASDGHSYLFTDGVNKLIFFPERRKCEINNVTVWLNEPIKGKPDDRSFKILTKDLDFITYSMLFSQTAPKPKRFSVLIDPGHGGIDDGAVSDTTGYREKDFTLSLSKKLGSILKKRGFNVHYTRTNDVELTLSDRTRMANEINADLFLSLHANKASNLQASGFETYVLTPSGHRGTAQGSRLCTWHRGNRNDFQNTLLGYLIQKKFCGKTPDRNDRGLKRQSFYVLRENSIPAVLIEFGFISNSADERSLKNPLWQTRQAEAVADAVDEYARKIQPLEAALTIKKQNQEKANAAWRKKLAAMKAKKTADKQPPQKQTREPLAPRPPLPPAQKIEVSRDAALSQTKKKVSPSPKITMGKKSADRIQDAQSHPSKKEIPEKIESPRTLSAPKSLPPKNAPKPKAINSLFDFYLPEKER